MCTKYEQRIYTNTEGAVDSVLPLTKLSQRATIPLVIISLTV